MIIINSPVLGHFDYSYHPGPFADNNIIYATGGYGNHQVAFGSKDVTWNYGPITHPHPSYKKFKEKYNLGNK